ncbi:DinB family protein [Marinoscillum pacificum]|uniref:DinB family protein n=1 Tax=Marinoscillum pacificum TaxID=392723 RepID=UPI002157E543|nr:DUF1572 domain-containing protein [Marinoscillum pacificum]
MKAFAQEFKNQCIYQMELNPPRIKKCFDQLSEEDVWKKPNESLNSIGNLVLHLCGNIRQYAISSLGQSPDVRSRSEEFSTTGGLSKLELIQKLEETVSEAVHTIKNVSEEELMRNRMVQGFNYSGIGIIIHVTEHFSYHTGQIAFRTKQLKNKDLGFYADRDLEIKNED